MWRRPASIGVVLLALSVPAGPAAAGNGSLDKTGVLSGQVTQAISGEPIADVEIRLPMSGDNGYRVVSTDLSGSYRFSSLPAGQYQAGTRNSEGWVDELFDNTPCPGGAFDGCGSKTGTPITIIDGESAVVDFALDLGGSISGTVTSAETGLGLYGITLIAWSSDGDFAGVAQTDSAGSYEIGSLATGSYFLATDLLDGSPHDELFDDIPCPGGVGHGCQALSGNPIAVQLGQVTQGVDFALAGGCVETDTAMCLTGHRFRVEATWRDFEGHSGVGQAVRLTSDSGYFWFFASSNIELVVKVLDACTLPGANDFWIFAGGLTNVEVVLTVTDTLTGEVKEYSNDLGTPFQPIQDTAAFYTCP